MIVPKYWSESKAKKIVAGKSYTIKRFGWSDESDEAAKAHSEQRLQEAVQKLEKEGDVRRVDHKVSYNGAEGIPIREEVISTYNDVVISRNSYGAQCLNTPNVLFADIDFETEASTKTTSYVTGMLLIINVAVAGFLQSWLLLLVGFVIALTVIAPVAKFVHQWLQSSKGGVEKQTMDRVEKVAKQCPELSLRVYRTPNGYRVLLMNDTYDPNSDEAHEILKQLDSDKTYIQMCRNQNCFRARVSPKPWRIGMDRIRPRPGVWPIKEDKMQQRMSWVEKYDRSAKDYSSCHFVAQLGSGDTAEEAEHVRAIHDKMCRATDNNLKIA